MRIVSGREADAMVERLAARGARLGGLEPRVRRIVDGVRRRWRAVASAVCGALGRAGREAASASVRGGNGGGVANDCSGVAQVFASGCARTFAVSASGKSPGDWMRTRGGISLGQMVRPLESVGCYVPGGRYPLVSTVLDDRDSGAGCGREEHPRGVAQAVDGSFGGGRDAGRARVLPRGRGAGHRGVGVRHQQHSREWIRLWGRGTRMSRSRRSWSSFDCAIDFLAGPTEAVIYELSSHERFGVPEFIAADLVAQAEHDPETLAVLITTSRELARAVRTSAAQLAKGNPIAQKSLRARGAVLVARLREQARDWANRLAPEHITVAEEDLPFIQNAGSVFVGDYSAQAAGDYASGPNHVLPTSGQARFRGGLSVIGFCEGHYGAAAFCERAESGSRRRSNVLPRPKDWRRMRGRSA